MTTSSDFKSFVKTQGSDYANRQTVRLGRLDGVTVETGLAGMLWARQHNGKEIQVYNHALVPSTFDLRVMVGIRKDEPSKWVILKVMNDYLIPADGGLIGFHHAQHEFHDAPGPDTVWVNRKQVTQLTVVVSNAESFQVQVYGGVIVSAEGIQYVASQIVNLGGYIPVSGAVYASVISNSSGALRVEIGTPFASSTSGNPAYIATPAAGEYLIGFVLLYDGMTELTDDLIGVPMAVTTPKIGSGTSWISVKDYGAIGNGIADDSSAITAAILVLNSAGSGVLYFPDGNYLVTSPLPAITANCLILGNGMTSADGLSVGSQITFTSSTDVLFTINSKYGKFQDIGLVNNASSVTAGAGIVVTSSYIGQRVDYQSISVKGFYIDVDVQVGQIWVMDSCLIIARTKYGVKIRNTVNADAGDWTIVNSAIYAEQADADAGVRIESSGGGRIVNTKINAGASPTHYFNYGIDLVPSGTTSILLIDNTSIENVSTNGIHVVGNWDYISITGVEIALYTSGAHNAIYMDGPDYFILDDLILIGNSPSTAAAAISLNNCTNGFVGAVETRYFTSSLSQTSCTNITTLPTLSSTTPADIGSSAAAGSGSAASKDDHVHEGVHSLAKSGSAQLTGDVTLSAGSNISLTQSGNDVSIASTASGSSGELLMQDGVSSPPVPLETEDGTDWLYQG